MKKLSMTNFGEETTIFGKSTKSPEVHKQKSSKYERREAVSGILFLFIILSELLIYSGNIEIALLFYAGLLLVLSLISLFVKEQETRNISQVFMLLPILRLINFSVPIFPEEPLLSFVFIYVPMTIPLAIIIIRQQFTHEQLGLQFRNIQYYLPGSVLLGLILGKAESFIVQIQLIPELSFSNILKLLVVMVFFVALIEELVFRSVLQTRLEETFGSLNGLIFTSLVFGFMNSGYGTSYELFFACTTGLLIGFMFQRTRSLPFVVLTHGFINIFSFGIFSHI